MNRMVVVSPEKNLFDGIKHIRLDGSEYWSARDLMPLLGYNKWENFLNVIKKSKLACQKSQNSESYHFPDIRKMVTLGSGSKRKILDYHLTRYACYLVAQNGDPRNSEVADAQTYFAIKTHEREQDEQTSYLRARREKRDKLTGSIKALNSVARQKGVGSGKFAEFTDAGTKGLYGGLNTNQVKRKKKIPDKANWQDRMGLDELTTNDFAKMLSRREIESGHTQGANQAIKINFQAHERVREAMQEFGKIMPEDLPAEPDIDITEKRLKDPNQVYCKTFSYNGEKILEIHLPDNFDKIYSNQLSNLLKNNSGTGRAIICADAQNLTKEVSWGNCLL